MIELYGKPIRRLGTVVALTFVWGEAAPAAGFDRDRWPDTDFSQRIVELSSIQSGGVPKDGIPALDDPVFADAGDVDWLAADEPVIALEIDGDARAYPLQIMIYHEIVNDTVGGVPVIATFCPLCNAAMVFERTVGGERLSFGVTGLLRNSDMVMYDRQSESWWQQFTGRGIVGRHAGTDLVERDARIVAFDDFRRAYPDGRVLTRETGYSRPYGQNPYRGYDSVDGRPFFPVESDGDSRLAPMERVLNLALDNRRRSYPLSVLKDEGLINDRLGEVPVVLFSQGNMRSALDSKNIDDARIIPAAVAFHRRVGERELTFIEQDGRVVDRQTGSAWDFFGRATDGPLAGKRLEQVDSGVHFAFAWLAFYPDSEIYGRDGSPPDHDE